jgi:NAD+ synthase
VTAHLAVEALGPDAVRGLVLPSAVNDPDNMSDAERVGDDLGIRTDTVEIGPLAEALCDRSPVDDPDRESAGNVRARLRAVVSYYIANAEDRLVLGTGNRSEALVGYFTKYGDGAVDCHPLGAIYKTQVRQLARHLGVPERIVEKPPTAGLWSGQTDADELGMPYSVLDAILALSVEAELTPGMTARVLDVDRALVDRVKQLHAGSAHKRRAPPSPAPPL